MEMLTKHHVFSLISCHQCFSICSLLHRHRLLIIEKHFVCVILFQKEADQNLNPKVEILR